MNCTKSLIDYEYFTKTDPTLTNVMNAFLTAKMNDIFTELSINLCAVNQVHLKVDEGLTIEYENGVYYFMCSVYVSGSTQNLIHYENNNTQLDTLINESMRGLIAYESTTLLRSYFIHKLVKKLNELKGQL